MELWTEKHKPGDKKGIVGQNKPLRETEEFLGSWKKGKALMYFGPAGVGKTLMAEAIAKERGWMLTVLNASDERKASSIEEALKESSRSGSLFSKGRLILIDEVDGIGAGDRGGVQAIIKVIKGSRFPVILIANDAYAPKLKSLRSHCKIVKFSKVNYLSIAKRLREIASEEGVSAEEEIIKNLARWSSGDMRSAITDLQNISQGKKELAADDLQVLGFRERGSNIFSILPAVFRSGNPRAAKKAIWECDRDPDEVFWWVESNIHVQFRDPGAVASAFGYLSKADLFRSRIIRQQNWAFKGYMVDMLSGISLSGEPSQGFTPFRPPDRLIMMGRTKGKRAKMKEICNKIGAYTHTSRKVAMREYLPLLRILLKKETEIPKEMGLTEEDRKGIVSG